MFLRTCTPPPLVRGLSLKQNITTNVVINLILFPGGFFNGTNDHSFNSSNEQCHDSGYGPAECAAGSRWAVDRSRLDAIDNGDGSRVFDFRPSINFGYLRGNRDLLHSV